MNNNVPKINLAKDASKKVETATKCSRALVLAHFDSAEKDIHILGALNEFLEARKIEEDVSSAEWSLYVSLWDDVKNGPRLFHNEEVTYVIVRKNKYGKEVKGRPSIHEILIFLFGNSIPKNLITDWYRMEICSRYCLVNNLDFSLFLLERLAYYNGIYSPSINRNKLIEIFKREDIQQKEEWINGLIEALEFLAILQFDGNNFQGYKVKFKAEPEYILTNIFGRSTGIDGLDYLFYGGIRSNYSPSQDNLSILISGSPGMGKTTLALSMAVQAAARGGLCIFFLFEPGIELIMQKIAQFFGKVLPYIRILSSKSEGTPDPNNDINHYHKGLLYLTNISKTPLQEIQDTSVRIATKFSTKNFTERMIVYDSISASEDYGKDPGRWRSFLFQTTSRLNTMGYRVIHITERVSAVKENIEDYVVDVDIRLTEQETTHTPYTFRKLEIAKARAQLHHRGPHIISIKPERGLSVYPSSTAVMGARRKRESRIRYQPNQPIDPGIHGFATYFSNIKKDSTPNSNAVHWWTKGSVTSLIGPRGTLKAIFSEVFASTSNIKDYDFVPSVLSLHFADDYPSSRIKLKRENKKPVLYGFRYDYCDGLNRKNNVKRNLAYILFRSGYLAAGHVLQVVRDLILEKRKEHTPIRRAIISDLGNIVPNFPSLKDDPVFIPALCELLTSEGITTLLIYSRPEHGGTDYVIDQIRSVSENIIKFRPVAYAGRKLTAISVERSGDSTHNDGIFELRESLSKNGDPKLEVLPTFDLMVGVRQGQPRHSKVRVLLHADTGLQYNYHNEMRKLHISMGSYDITIHGHAFEFAKHAVARHVTSAEKALWIIQVDANESMNHSNLKNPEVGLLADLSLSIKDIEKTVNNLTTLHHDPNNKHYQLFSIPYFLNPSFLVIREEFRNFALSSEKWQPIGQGEGEYSWNDLIEAASEFLGESSVENPKWADYATFDCPFETTEPLNCLFLEILCSLDKENFNKLDFSVAFGEDSPFQGPKKDVLVDTIVILKRLLEETYDDHKHDKHIRRKKIMKTNYSAMDPNNNEYARPYVTEKAVMWRHWYNTYRQMAADMSLGDCRENPGLSIIRLPGSVSTNGDWHLAILEGSIGIRQGINILFDEFINRKGAITRLAQGVGLPPFRDFYDKQKTEFKLSVSGISPRWFQPYVEGKNVIYRSNLGHYETIKSYLNGALASMVSLKEKNIKFRQEINKRFKALDQLIRISIP